MDDIEKLNTDNQNNDLTAFEEEMLNQLLIEQVKRKDAEIFENVVFEGKKRYYIEDLTKRDYSLENTTPYQLMINEHVFSDTSWGLLLKSVSEFLLDTYPEYEYTICDFRAKWSKQVIFTWEEKTNYKIMKNGLYINVNHTALHSCWLLQDLLEHFNIYITSVYFLIHRPSGAEPKNVKEYIENRFKNEFKNYIIFNKRKSENYATKVILYIEKYLNKMLSSISKSYTNFFLFDSNTIMYNYIKKTQEMIKKKFDVKGQKTLNLCLDLLIEYYKQ